MTTYYNPNASLNDAIVIDDETNHNPLKYLCKGFIIADEGINERLYLQGFHATRQFIHVGAQWILTQAPDDYLEALAIQQEQCKAVYTFPGEYVY